MSSNNLFNPFKNVSHHGLLQTTEFLARRRPPRRPQVVCPFDLQEQLQLLYVAHMLCISISPLVTVHQYALL